MSENKSTKKKTKTSEKTTEKPEKSTKVAKTSKREKVVENKENRYQKFLEENKKTWLWFNLLCTLGSIGLAVGTYFIVTTSVYDC